MRRVILRTLPLLAAVFVAIPAASEVQKLTGSTGIVQRAAILAVTTASPDKVTLRCGGAPVAVQLTGAGLDRSVLKAVALRDGQPDPGVRAILGTAVGGDSRAVSLVAASGTAAGAITLRLESGSAKIDVPLKISVTAVSSGASPSKKQRHPDGGGETAGGVLETPGIRTRFDPQPEPPGHAQIAPPPALLPGGAPQLDPGVALPPTRGVEPSPFQPHAGRPLPR